MKQRLLVGAVLLGGTILGACGGAYYNRGYYARSAPPPPRYYGAIGRAPAPGYVWMNGYWDHRGNGWRWTDGRWTRPARGRSHWVAPEWRYDGRAYRMRRGYWR